MASNSPQLLLLTLLSLTLLLNASAVNWTPMDPGDPKAVEIAEFAVSEYNKRITDSLQKLIYEKVLKGEYAEVSALPGIDYRLMIQARTNDNCLHSGQYEAVVSDKLPEHLMRLISLRKV